MPSGSEVRWGIHAVEEALRAGSVRRLLLEEGYARNARLVVLAELAGESDVPVETLDESSLAVRAQSDHHQGALAEVRPFRYLALDELLDAADQRNEPPFLLVLDGVEDPQNFGAILRTADAAGAHGVVVAERRAAPVTPAVARASAGATEFVPVAQVTNLARAVEALKARGIWVYALDMDGETDFDAPAYDAGVAIVAGAEGKGVSRLVRERSDGVLRIPLHGHVESLNVSVATALSLYAVRRARSRATKPTL